MLISRLCQRSTKPARQQAHEAGEADQFDPGGVQGVVHGRFEARLVGVVAVADDGGRDTRLPGALQPIGVGLVGQHQHDFRREGGIGAGVDQGLEIAPPARDQDTDLQACHAVSTPSITTRSTSPMAGWTSPMR